jgi:adenylosuccinate lyase
MPHKRNPIVIEQLCGLSTVLRSNLIARSENIPLCMKEIFLILP